MSADEVKYLWRTDRPVVSTSLLDQIDVHRALLGLTGTLWMPHARNKREDAPWKCPWCGYQMTLSSCTPPNNSYYCWCECGFHDGPIRASEYKEKIAERKR